MKKRALSGQRISVKKDDSTSIERQDDAILGRIGLEGFDHIGSAVDVNVSASKVNPFKRPELGPWLRDRMDEFDVLIFWRMDRAVRSMADLHELMAWAKKYRKQIIFCEGPGSEYDFDFTGTEDDSKLEMALLLATVIAWAARIESMSISERVKSSHEYLRREGEWGGGMVPYGLKPQRKKGAKRGWELVHNPETLPALLDIIERVCNGERLLPICRDLNSQGIPTPRDYWAAKKAKERQDRTEFDAASQQGEVEAAPRKWSTPGLKSMLTSRVLLGEWVFDGALNVDPEGEPIKRCEPVISQSKWDDLQVALATLGMDSKQKYSQANPLLGVAYCARCGLPYYLKQEKQKGRVYSNLSCRSRHGDQHTTCGQASISLRYAEELVTQVTLLMIGDFEATRRVFVPGDDRSEELARLKARVEDLEEEWDEGLISSRERFLDRKKKLHLKIESIGSEPVRQARYDWIGTGKTYSQMWPTITNDARLKLMRDLGIQIYLGRGDSEAAITAHQRLDDQESGFRRSFVLEPAQSNEFLSAVQDGARVKKDLRVWFLQSSNEMLPDAVAKLSRTT